MRSGVAAAEIEIICSDRTEHRRRVETRASDVAGLTKPRWDEVTAHDYEDWERSRILIDTARQGVDEAVAELISKLEPLRRAQNRN